MADQPGVDFLKSEQERLTRLLAIVGYPMRERVESVLTRVNERLAKLQQARIQASPR